MFVIISHREYAHNYNRSKLLRATMMKSLALTFALLSASSSAFAPTRNHAITTPSTLSMSEAPIDDVAVTPLVSETRPSEPARSQALPFLPRPAYLDGSLAGDVGFDPFGFAKSESDLMNYREAEVKHAR
jgi:hypothetical protein